MQVRTKLFHEDLPEMDPLESFEKEALEAFSSPLGKSMGTLGSMSQLSIGVLDSSISSLIMNDFATGSFQSNCENKRQSKHDRQKQFFAQISQKGSEELPVSGTVSPSTQPDQQPSNPSITDDRVYQETFTAPTYHHYQHGEWGHQEQSNEESAWSHQNYSPHGSFPSAPPLVYPWSGDYQYRGVAPEYYSEPQGVPTSWGQQQQRSRKPATASYRNSSASQASPKTRRHHQEKRTTQAKSENADSGHPGLDFPSTTTSNGKSFPPLRPLSAYNYFFRVQRDRMIGARHVDDENDENQCLKKLLMGHWKQDRTKKRAHRKTHGKISFTELSKCISNKWKSLDDADREFFKLVAATDMKRYKAEMDQYLLEKDMQQNTRD